MKTLLQHAKQFNTLNHTKTVKAPTKRTVPARKRHTRSQSKTIQITTTGPMINALGKIMETGLYGNSVAATAERLLCDAVRAVLKEGTLLRAKKVLC